MTVTWLPLMGDPTIIGWTTVFAYLGGAALCGIAARRSPPREPGERLTDRIFWLFISTLLVLLAINKQLDLQTLLTEIGRDVAKAQGWYEDRRPVQALFVIALAAIGAGALLILVLAVRTRPPTVKLALFGLTFLGLFVVLKSAWINQMYGLAALGIADGQWHRILEFTGIAIVALAAAAHSARRSTGIGVS